MGALLVILSAAPLVARSPLWFELLLRGPALVDLASPVEGDSRRESGALVVAPETTASPPSSCGASLEEHVVRGLEPGVDYTFRVSMRAGKKGLERSRRLRLTLPVTD